MSINRSARPFSVSTTDRNLTVHAGAVLIRAAAQAVGLSKAITAHLELKKRARGLSEANSVLAMAEAVALGQPVSTTSRSRAPIRRRRSSGASPCPPRRPRDHS